MFPCVCSRSHCFLTTVFATIAYVHGLLFCLFSLCHPSFATFTREEFMRVSADKKRAVFIASESCTPMDFLFLSLACCYLVSPRSLLPSYGLPSLSVLFQCVQALKLNMFLCPGHPLQDLKYTLVIIQGLPVSTT